MSSPWVFKLDRPEYGNALNEEAMRALLDQVRGDRTLVLTGSGDNFCTGIDMAYASSKGEEALDLLFDCLDALLASPKPTVAAVSGNAMGAGWLLCLCCDIVFAEPDASFSLPEIKFGIPPFVALDLLAEHIGPDLLTRVACNAEPASGADLAARDIVRPPADTRLEEAALKAAAALATHPPEGYAALKYYRNRELREKVAAARDASRKFLPSLS